MGLISMHIIARTIIVGMEDKQIINVRIKLFYNNKAERDCYHHQQVDYEVVCYWV